MAQEIGESREKWGWDVWHMAEDFANHMKTEKKPFYVVYACKEDKGMTNKFGRPTFKQTLKAYHSRPPLMLGILVWYVNHPKGIFKFIPECSAPHDVPLDPKLLSEKAQDALPTVIEKGESMKVLLS